MASPRTPRQPTTRQSRAKGQATPAPPVAAILRWLDKGACAHADPAIFAASTPDDVDEAKRICAACSIRAQCRDYALTTGQESGVWGGLSEAERQALLEQQEAQPGTDIGGAA